MREFKYDKSWQKLLTPEIVALLTQIHEFKGAQNLFVEAKADTLTQLVTIAKIQSTEASNKIEGIQTSDARLKQIVLDKTTPLTRSEKEIAGYRDVLATIHNSHDVMPPKPSIILQLHRDLYKFSGLSFGGRYKNTENAITEERSDGTTAVRFQPLQAWETPAAIEQLCLAYDKMIDGGKADSLLIIPMFILDFLCIHPFNDGNGRMSRLLTLLLLYRSGYIVGKYVSLENIIEKSKETYYEVLQQSSQGWHEGVNDYAPFVEYTLGLLIGAYREFSSRVQYLNLSNISKPERIEEMIKGTLGEIKKTDILQRFPDISQITVQRTLTDLQKSEKILKRGGGRYTSYIWNREYE